jgi:hypothetical protein
MDITVDKVSVDYLKSLPVNVFNFLIKACKVAIYKNQGNKQLISKIYNLFLTFSKTTQNQTMFNNLIIFPSIVCKPKPFNYIQSYNELHFRNRLMDSEFKLIPNRVLLTDSSVEFTKFETIIDNDIFTLQNITDNKMHITSSLLTYKYKNADKAVKSLGYRFKQIDKYSYITDRFEGNLNLLKVRSKWDKNPNLFIIIAEEIRKQMVNSLNLNYVFANMNSENILYKCNDYEPDQIAVYINIDYSKTFTYPPPEYKYCMYYGEKITFKNKEEKEQVLSWNIGILLLLLIDNGKYLSNFFYPNIKQHTSLNIEKAKKKLLSVYPDHFSNYLNLKAEERPSIYNTLLKNYFF